MASSLSASTSLTSLRVLTLFTGVPLDNIGVMTMKMISSTNITSTSGVTLISDTIAGAPCFLAI